MKQGPIPSLLEARRRERTSEPTHPQPAHDQRPGDGPTVAVPTQRPGVQRALSVVALQRSAGNAAVTALLAAKARPAGTDKVADIDAALHEARNDQPQLDTLEKGLKVAKDAGVPVDIDGAEHKPPASALAVTRTGFGPSSVPAKKPVPPPKPTPAVSPMAKAARPVPPKTPRALRLPLGPAPRVLWEPPPRTGWAWPLAR